MEFLIFVIVLIALMAGVEYFLNRKLESNEGFGDLAKANEEFLASLKTKKIDEHVSYDGISMQAPTLSQDGIGYSGNYVISNSDGVALNIPLDGVAFTSIKYKPIKKRPAKRKKRTATKKKSPSAGSKAK